MSRFFKTANDEPALLGDTRCLGNWPVLRFFLTAFSQASLKRYRDTACLVCVCVCSQNCETALCCTL